MTRISRPTATSPSSALAKTSPQKRSSEKGRTDKHQRKQNANRKSAIDIEQFKRLYKADPNEAVLQLNQAILKVHPVGKQLSEDSLNKVAGKIQALLGSDAEVELFLKKILGGN